MLENLSPTARLNDAIQGMNDAARWGRIDLAVQYIEPAYHDRFLKIRRGWNRRIKVADADLVGIQMVPDQDVAVARIAFSWYRLESMTLHHTVVRQVWNEHDDGYLLGSENVVEGDGTLFVPSRSGPDNGNRRAVARSPAL
jgi:hypothetical protein